MAGVRFMNKKKTTEQYVREAIEVHGDMYDYNRIVYIRSTKKVEVLCRKHGSFWVLASSHLCGTGCPVCCNTRPLKRRGLKIDRTPNDSGKRICSTCKGEFDIDYFYKDNKKGTKDGLFFSM